MIESRNSMDVLDPVFYILWNASRVSTFRLGMQTIPKKICLFLLFDFI